MKILNVHLLSTKSLKLRLVHLKAATLATLLFSTEDRLVYFDFGLFWLYLRSNFLLHRSLEKHSKCPSATEKFPSMSMAWLSTEKRYLNLVYSRHSLQSRNIFMVFRLSCIAIDFTVLGVDASNILKLGKLLCFPNYTCSLSWKYAKNLLEYFTWS